MIYFTGDTHGDVEKLFMFKERFGLTTDDIDKTIDRSLFVMDDFITIVNL